MKLARLLLPAALLASSLASAQNLDLPAGDVAAASPDRPARGASMATVESRFGAPVTRHTAVGDPPITRWDYPQFSVFFEHDKVLHAVVVRAAGN